MSDRPAFARNGESHPAGKLDARIDVPITADLEEAIQAFATFQGIGKAELVRNILEEVVWGRFHVWKRKLTRGDGSGNG